MTQKLREVVIEVAPRIPNDPDPNNLFWSWVFGTFEFYVTLGLKGMQA